MDLLLPKVREPALILPSYVKLDMAFGVGAGSTLFDKSRYRSHGAISGASWVSGLHGKALDFDKTGPDYVEIPAAYDQLNFTSEKFSLIMRVKPVAVVNLQVLFDRGFGGIDGWRFLLHTNGRLDLETYQSGASQLSYGNSGYVLAGNDYTLGFSRNGAVVTIFVNGVDIPQTSGTHVDPVTCARVARLGKAVVGTTYPLDGKIEFLRIFGGIALSTSAHLAWHNALK